MGLENPQFNVQYKSSKWTTPIITIAAGVILNAAALATGVVGTGLAAERMAAKTDRACGFALRFQSPEIVHSVLGITQQEIVIAGSAGNHDAVGAAFYKKMGDVSMAFLTDKDHGWQIALPVKAGELGVRGIVFGGTLRRDLRNNLFHDSPPPDQTVSIQSQCRAKNSRP